MYTIIAKISYELSGSKPTQIRQETSPV